MYGEEITSGYQWVCIIRIPSMTGAFLETLGLGSGGEGAPDGEEAGTGACAGAELVHTSVMAWDHARLEEDMRLEVSHLLDTGRRVGACGDYFGRGIAEGVEAEALSGLSLAESLAPLLLTDK